MSAKPLIGDYKVEYAASGRSTCKLTKNTIPKDALRIGEFKQSPHFDGVVPDCKLFSLIQRVLV